MDSLRKDPELYKGMTDMLKRKFQSCFLNHHYLNNPIEDVTVSKKKFHEDETALTSQEAPHTLFL